MELRTERLKLSALSLAYLDEIHQLHASPQVDEFNTLGIPASLETTHTLLNDWLLQQNSIPRISYIFCIRLKESDLFIGLIALNLGKLHYRIAEVWYKLNPVFWQQGYASEALLCLLEFGFTSLGLHRIEAGCAVDNLASIRVLEKAGMSREGMKRKILPIRGEWTDNYFYSILDTDYISGNNFPVS